MTLTIHANHDIRSLHEEPAVAHIHFHNEDGKDRFLADNRRNIKSVYETWSVDWEPMLTVTAKR